MGGMSKLNTLLDPIGSILGFSPTEKLFGGGGKSEPAPPVPSAQPVNGVTAEKTRAGQTRRRQVSASQSILTQVPEEGLGG